MNSSTSHFLPSTRDPRIWFVGLIAAACLLTTLGCDSGPSTCSVSGKITFKGKAVTSGLINFLPEQGQPFGGGIGSDGSYEFQLPPGHYKVRIDTPPALPADWSEKDGDPLPKLLPRQLPEKYGKYPTSGLTATVSDQSPTQVVDFVLPIQ